MLIFVAGMTVNPTSSSSYSLAWRRVERNLNCDFTLATAPQTSSGTLDLSASWDGMLNTQETSPGLFSSGALSGG
jgi:hypothetical protein